MIPNEIAGGQGPGSALSFDFPKCMLHDDRRRPSSRWWEGGEHVAKGMGMRKEKKKPKKKK
jgi:hypothetical protein